MNLESYFEEFRNNTIGYNQTFQTPYGEKRIVYADWTASGRLYAPIEDRIANTFGPFTGNTHSEASETGERMTGAYRIARDIIKKHVNADSNDVIIMSGFGMTSAVNKLQRISGLKISERYKDYVHIPEDLRPVVFVTHMEHHSNHISWLETCADVICIKPDGNGLIDLNHLEESLKEYKNRRVKIGSFTACSNITGIQTPYHQMAKVMHQHGGICFVDFAASAPYISINMHPADPLEKLDGILFSPHKFLGGPGASGVLIFDSRCYSNKIPDAPGGGTVNWTNPWGGRSYVSDIETREDGGTPGFLQAIRAALAVNLKEKMNVGYMQKREEEILAILFKQISSIPGLKILAENSTDRLGILSFYVDNIHYNLLIKILNDRFGIQMRGGCSCAGTYGHYLLHIDESRSNSITKMIDSGDLSKKPGWIRLSIHPMMKDDEIYFIVDSIKTAVGNIDKWEKDYTYINSKNEFINKHNIGKPDMTYKWFELA